MVENTAEMQREIMKLESRVTSLAIANVELVLLLQVFIRQANLDAPITIGKRQPAKPSELLDKLWNEVFDEVIGDGN